MKIITVEVTQEDIDHGVKGECGACPVALAMKRATGRTWYAGYGSAVTRSGSTVSLPVRARVFIIRFDREEYVAPFTFTIVTTE